MAWSGLIASTADEIVFDCALAGAPISVNQVAIIALEVKQNAVSACLEASIIAFLKKITLFAGTLAIINREAPAFIAHETGLLVIHQDHRYAAVKEAALIVQQKAVPAVAYERGSVELEDTFVTLGTIRLISVLNGSITACNIDAFVINKRPSLALALGVYIKKETRLAGRANC